MAEQKKMKGVLLDKVGGEFEIVSDLDVPIPGPGQILVKSLVTGINPVEGFMQQTGMLVLSFPIVLGCDGAGIVVGLGPNVTKFKSGDGVFGCTRLGQPEYGTFQEYFLMDEHLAFMMPVSWRERKGMMEGAATVGVGVLTACLGLISGTNIKFAATPVTSDSKWIIILGGASTVGQYSIQVAKLCGYHVLASCSPSNDTLVTSLGADATFNYKITLEEQIAEIGRVTDGKFSKVYDASGMAAETGMSALAVSKEPESEKRIFATTNDWMPIEEKAGIEIFKVALGQIGRKGGELAEVAVQVNRDITTFIPVLEKWLESGEVKPLAFVDANEGKEGFESVLKGLEEFGGKKSDGRKLVVRISQQ